MFGDDGKFLPSLPCGWKAWSIQNYNLLQKFKQLKPQTDLECYVKISNKQNVSQSHGRRVFNFMLHNKLFLSMWQPALENDDDLADVYNSKIWGVISGIIFLELKRIRAIILEVDAKMLYAMVELHIQGSVTTW